MLPGFAAAGGVSALFSSIQKFTETAERFRNLNRQTNLSTDTLQRFDFVAKQTGLTLQEIINSYERLQVAQRDAQRGTTTYIDAFRDLGIQVWELQRMGPEELFTRVSAALARSGDATAISRALLGRAGGRYLSAVRQNIPGLMAQAPVISAGAIERAATISDELTTIRQQLASDLAPTLLSILEAVRSAAQGIEALRQGAEDVGSASELAKRLPGGWLTAGAAAAGDPVATRAVNRTIQEGFSEYLVFYLKELVRQSTRTANAVSEEP